MLEAIGAWERADVETLMDYITDDCVYITTTGPDPGTRYEGRAAVREGFSAVLRTDDHLVGRFSDPTVVGDRGFVEWTLSTPEGLLCYRGCDLFQFEDDRIRRKDAFRKVEG